MRSLTERCGLCQIQQFCDEQGLAAVQFGFRWKMGKSWWMHLWRESILFLFVFELVKI